MNEEHSKMYHGFLVVNEYKGHKDVCFQLGHIGSRREQGQVLPYDQLITEYDTLDKEQRDYSEGCIDEMFLLSEIHEIVAHFKDTKDAIFSYTNAFLPIDGNSMAWSWMPTGGGIHLNVLTLTSNNQPVIKINAGFDSRFCECSACKAKN